MVYINNYSLICPLGNEKTEIAQKLFSATHGLHQTNDMAFHGSTYIGECLAPLVPIPPFMDKYFLSRSNQLLYNAFLGLKDELTPLKLKDKRVAIIVGTSLSGTLEFEDDLSFFDDIRGLTLYNPPEFLKSVLDIDGICYGISTACTSASKSVISAHRLIENDLADIVICGGVDSLCRVSIQGFESLGAISEDICKPFSANRNGINIGEAAGLFILSKEPYSFELMGYGETTDSHHFSAPDPEGKGALNAMLKACEMAGIEPQDISYINAHGTATELNDAMEAQAFSNLYPRYEDMPYISSTKSLTGHCLGASAAVELAFLCMLLDPSYNQKKIAIPQGWDGLLDPSLPKVNIATKDSHIAELSKAIAMSNNYAFGGNNTSLIVKAVECE